MEDRSHQFEGYVMTMIRNACLNGLRNEGVRARKLVDVTDANRYCEMMGMEPPMDPETDALRSDVEAQVSAAMNCITPAHSRALKRRYWDGSSYDDIAKAEEIEMGTVMSRLSRAKAKLREAIEGNRRLWEELMEP